MCTCISWLQPNHMVSHLNTGLLLLVLRRSHHGPRVVSFLDAPREHTSYEVFLTP